MKGLKVFGLFALCLVVVTSSLGDNNFYNSTIFVEQNCSQKIKDIASELILWLKKGTGKDFTITSQQVEGGIFILNKDSQLLPEIIKKALQGKRKEAFSIYSQGNKLFITGNSDIAIQYGIYRYLDVLGYRWFFPGESWTIVPQLKKIDVNMNLIDQPIFVQRDFFGTGGFGGRLPIDPEMKLQKKWEEWKKRNYLGGEIRISGHAGESFNSANKSVLLEHPEYLAEIDGIRQPWTPGTKPCYSNPGLIELYIKDRLNQLKRQIDADPDGPGSFAVSVEPSDGGGHCQCSECKKIGSVSDRVFSLANHVARQVAKKFPGKYVSLLAYNEHAAVPEIELEPNVYVVVVPYGFQRTGYSGDELIELWGKKTKFFGVYDYWSIPDWNNDIPDFNYLETPAKKIRFWKKSNVAAYLSESTYSSGAMGIAWYLSSRLLWNPDVDEKKILDDFYSKAFGEARIPMQRMLERWSKSFRLTDHELALSFRDVAEADKLAKKPDIKERINDYKRYIQYLALFYEYQNAKPTTPERKQAVRDLLDFMWRIYDSTMVHVYRMHQLIVNRYERDEELRQEWDFKNKEKWESITPVSSEELDEMVKQGIEKYKPYDFEHKTFKTDNLVPVVRNIKPSAEPKLISTHQFWGTHNFKFFVPENIDEIILKMKIGKKENHPGDRVVVVDPEGKVLFNEFIAPDGDVHDIKIQTQKKGIYSMTVSDQKIAFSIMFPDWLPFVVTDYIVISDWQTKVYFYVPSGTKRLAMYCESVVPVKIFDGDGKEVKYQGTKVIVADVPAGQDGKIWTLSHHKLYTPSPAMFNVPNVFGFSKETMMIPAECQK
ncbi:MAG: DUF4838 domain-containing protein [bacterium]|nr:DUF4838 domain-containing protein [bacterium]